MFSWCKENCSRLPFTWPVNSQEDAGRAFQWRSGNHRRQVTTFVTWNCHMMNTRRRFLYQVPTRSPVFIFVCEGHLCKATPVNNVIFNRFFFLFLLIWVFFVAYIRGLLLYLIKLVTLSQVLHFNDGAAVWVCLCSRVHPNNVCEETATISIWAGVVLGKKKKFTHSC